MKIALCGIHEEVNTFAVETMGLATVTTKMSLPDQNADEHSDLELTEPGRLFHRQVSRETFRVGGFVSPSSIT